MARGRILSRTLGSSRRFNALADQNPDLAEFAQLLFTLLIPHADDFGRMSGDPQSVKFQVFPGSSRKFPEFWSALEMLHITLLIDVYTVDDSGDIWLQVNKFDEHQQGLHKRTESRIQPPSPGNSRKFPEIPGRARAELNRTELVIRKDPPPTPAREARANVNGSEDGRSKRPIFTGQRVTVFEWMLDDCTRILSEHTDAFDLHEWFFALDAMAVTKGLVIPKRDSGQWLQAQLVAEAQRRGIHLTMAQPIEKIAGKLSQRLMSARANIQREAKL